MHELLGKKIGMTQIFDQVGNAVPVTVVQAGPCYVVAKKTVAKDGYCALQVGFEKSKKATKALAQHFKKAGLEPLKFLREIKIEDEAKFSPGQEIKVDIFKAGDFVDVSGTSIGKGFAGTVKRWKFGRGPMTHGSKSHRIPGSIGAGTTPGNVKPGKKMPGHLGNARVTVKNLKVIKVDHEKNLLLIAGAVPGAKQALLRIRKK